MTLGNNLNFPGMTRDAKAYLLELAFKQARAGDTFLGLSLIQEGDVSLAALEENEPVNSAGYNRRRLTSGDWNITETLTGVRAETNQVTFRNPGPEKWPSINAEFLVSSDGRLLGWTYLQTIRDLFAGDEERVSIWFEFT